MVFFPLAPPAAAATASTRTAAGAVEKVKGMSWLHGDLRNMLSAARGARERTSEVDLWRLADRC